MKRMSLVFLAVLTAPLLGACRAPHGGDQDAAGLPGRAFVRALTGRPSLDLSSDAGPLLHGAPLGFSSYAALDAGPHLLKLGNARLTAVLQPGEAYTLAQDGGGLKLFWDAANAHKFKAQLRVYNLGDSAVDVVTADGQTVFEALAPGSAVSRLVTPERVDLHLARQEEPVGNPVRFRLGAAHAYSVALLGGDVVVSAVSDAPQDAQTP